MKRTKIQPTKISQPLQGKRITNANGQYIKSPSTCTDGNANPSYHPWENGTLNNFLIGKQIQCGRKSTYLCNLRTVNWIKGYRNTCPIAGCCGTFNRPTPLLLNGFNFRQKGIQRNIKISNIKVSYRHMATGVDVRVGSGSEKKTWTGYFPYVDIILYINTGGDRRQVQRIRHNQKVPLAKKGTVIANFTKTIANFDPNHEDLVIEINYPSNGDGKYSKTATNPSIIYADNLNIEMTYDFINNPVTPKLSVIHDTNTIVTDSRNPNNSAGNNNCRTMITHTVRYSDVNAQNIKIVVPNGVRYKKQIKNGEMIVVYQDTSGKAGIKEIKYSASKTTVTKGYKAVLYKKPVITINSEYTKDQAYKIGDQFYYISGNCWNRINIYLEDNKTSLMSFTRTNPISQEAFLKAINTLSCGKHGLNLFIDDVFSAKLNVNIHPPQILLKSNLQGEYRQKQDEEDMKYLIPVEIERTDINNLNHPITITVIDTATQDESQVIELLPKTIETVYINIFNPGVFELKCSYHDGCSTKQQSFGKYKVIPIHRQSYDKLIMQAIPEDNEYKSIVIRKGDKQGKPFAYTDAHMSQSMNDFLLFGKDGKTMLGELGYGIISLKNMTKRILRNICIELNPLFWDDKDDSYDPLIMEWETGMLKNFYDNFFILNPNLKNIVEIFNMDNKTLINEGTENVILCIKELQVFNNVHDVLEIKIPFSHPHEKEIYMNFLLLGIATDFIDLDNTSNSMGLYTNEDFYREATPEDIELFASHTSKKEERGCLCISLKTVDLLSPELVIEGEDLDRNDITNTSDLDITYGLRLSSRDCDKSISENIEIQTRIINDSRLIPVGYQTKGEYKDFRYFNRKGDPVDIDHISQEEYVSTPLDDIENGILVERGFDNLSKLFIGETVYLRYKDMNDEIKYLNGRTDKNGLATISFMIPEHYTGKEFYLTDILENVDIFYNGDSMHKKAFLDNNIKNALIDTKIYGLGFLIEQNEEKRFINFGEIPFDDIEDITNIYLIGQLLSGDTGINDKIIEYNYRKNDMERSKKAVTYMNKTSDFGEQYIDADGIFKINIYEKDITTYNLLDIWHHSLLYYAGDLTYNTSNLCGPDNRIEYNDDFNDSKKMNTYISCLHDYRKYEKGETINISVELKTFAQVFLNIISIKNQLFNCRQDIHIFYRSCKGKNTEGYKTVFKTISDNVVPNQIEEYIYCNVDTDLHVLARLEKRMIENHNVNVLTINAINNYKPNKEVIIKGFIGPNADKKRLGDYLALSAIDIDKEQYSYDQNADIVYWNIGDMNQYETKKCNILLESEDIGHNMIYICGFDYLTPDKESAINTELIIEFEANDIKEKYYADDILRVKAYLRTADIHKVVYGQIYFDIEYVDKDGNPAKKKSQAYISAFENEIYGLATIKLIEGTDYKISAYYEGAQISSIKYLPSESNILTIPEVNIYDTIIRLSSEQEEFTVNEDIQIKASILYDPQIIEEETIYKKYFDKDIDIRFFIEDQKLNNISYHDKDYIVSFKITKQGRYTVKVHIPKTYKTQESLDTMTITIKEEEKNV